MDVSSHFHVFIKLHFTFLQKERVKDFKVIIIKYLESLVQTQQQVKQHNVYLWPVFHVESFLF